ncbi:MAG: secretion protein [Rhodoferax sp.]|uniref:secretion protein n=1 Tax=Rhodoferax sp. TaxID=50421 RepID=UPI002609E170|nr:secretion protein [Rhodoferax sp.]MDD2880834.1 secretion protein [Rhodoferax sp.]
MKKLASIKRFATTSVALAAMLCMSPTAWAQAPEKSFLDMVNKFALTPTGEPESEMLAKATVAVNFIKRMELPQANKAINEALQLDARNSYLHFLNGFVYHLQARQGDSQKNEMAIEGYQQALRIDRGNWIAQEFLGLAYMDLKKFEEAKTSFSDVLLMTPDSAVSLYGMMVASYLTGDAVTACTMADQFQKIATDTHDGFIRSSISVYASCGNFDKADQMRTTLAALNREPTDVGRVDQRLAQWKSFYRQNAPTESAAAANSVAGLIQTSLSSAATAAPPERFAQAFTLPSSGIAQPMARPAPSAVVPQANRPTEPNAPELVRAADSASDGSPRMVLVDVVLVSTQELVSTSKGVNLLSALTLQLGSLSGGKPAYSRENISNSVGGAAESVSTAITRAVTIPALAYSLNIANASNSMNEVLARPTLAAMEGMPSEFFSGTNLSAGVVSASSQGGTTVVPVEKRFGVKLAVTPVFLSNGRVQLKVDAQRTSLNATADNPKVAYQIEIAETTANANVVMQLGDTLVLSGLSEKTSSNARDGVPVLQDVPVVQYFFSNKKTNDIQRSVLILITPRAPVYAANLAQGTAISTSTQVLREKFGFSGSTPSSVEAILSHLKTNDLFREFRQGDVTLERWDRMHSTGDRLRQALGFLYY